MGFPGRMCDTFSVQPGLDAGPDYPVHEIAAAACPGDVLRACPAAGGGVPRRAAAPRSSGGAAGRRRADDASSSGGPRPCSDDGCSLRGNASAAPLPRGRRARDDACSCRGAPISGGEGCGSA
jgi:hypothetical protein